MAADGEVLYEARIDDSNVDKDLDNLNEKIEKKTGSAMDKLKSLTGGTAKAIGAGLIAAGSGAVAIGTMATNSAVSMDQAMNQFIASTGKGIEETERYQDVLENIYKNNYGDSFEDIANSMATINKELGDMPDEELQKVTESAYALRDTFEYDIAESTRAAKAMMDNFGISGEEALSKIAAGAQNGLDYSGELLDSISEYSVQFAKIGLDADDMFKIFEKGAESGAFNLDKVGDAVKELSIRVIDGSDTTKEGFQAIGLNADEMAAKFAAGGDTAKEAFQQTIESLAAMEDPIAQNAAGVALFGTQWEDLGVDAVTALAEIEDGVYDAGEAMETLKKVKYDDLGSMFEGLKRSVELLILPLGEQLIPLLTEMIEVLLPIIEEVLPPLIDAIGQVLGQLMPVIEEVIPILLELINELLPPMLQIVEAILPLLLSIITALVPVLDLLLSVLTPILDLFIQLLSPILNLITQAIGPLISIVAELMDLALTPLIGIIKVLASVFTSVFSDVLQSASSAISSVMKILQGLIQFIKGVFTGDWRSAWQGVKSIFSGIVSGFGTIFKSPINAIIGGINTFIRGLNRIQIPDWVPGVGGLGFHISEIPRLRVGMDYVPSDDFPALLHRGEAVLTKEDNLRYQKLGGVAGMEALTASRAHVLESGNEGIDYNRMYNAVKSGAEAANLKGYFDPKAAGQAMAQTVNHEFENTAEQNERYTK